MLWRNDSHMIDIMNYFAEANPIWVVGELGTGACRITVPDITAMVAEMHRSNRPRMPIWAYDYGVRAFLSGMKTAAPILQVELIGSKGTITVGDSQAWLRESDRERRDDEPDPSGLFHGRHAGCCRRPASPRWKTAPSRNRLPARRARRSRSSKASSNRRRTVTTASISASSMRLVEQGLIYDAEIAPPRSAIVRVHVARRIERWVLSLLISRGAGPGPPGGQLCIMGSDNGRDWEVVHPGLTHELDGIEGDMYAGYLAELTPGVLTGSFVWVDRSNPTFRSSIRKRPACSKCAI